MSMLSPYTHSPLMFPMSLSGNYTYTLQQKLQATKQKLKRSNKLKTESKRSSGHKADKVDAGHSANDRPRKHSSNKSNDLKTVQNQKSSNVQQPQPDVICPQPSKLSVFPGKYNEPKPSHISEPVANTSNRVPNIFADYQFAEGAAPFSKKPKPPHKTPSEKSKMSSAIRQQTTPKPLAIPRNPKSVYIDLDSAAEQARLKSTVLQNKVPERKTTTPVPLSPAMLLSSCPGLSITPVVGAADKIRKPVDAPSLSRSIVHSSSTKPTTSNFNFEHLQQLGNSITITKAEKSGGNKSSTPEVILLDYKH